MCMPCSRLKCSKCCRKNQSKTSPISEKLKNQQDTSSSGSNHQPAKSSCWKKMRCCGGKKKSTNEDVESIDKFSVIDGATTAAAVTTAAAGAVIDETIDHHKPGKCRLCMDKFICCRKTNKIESTTDDESEEVRKCCFCIPCRRKVKRENVAWSENRRESILSEPKKQ